MKRLTVPGGWVDVREPEDVPERLRRRVTTMSSKAATMAGRLSDDATAADADDVLFVLEFNDAIAMCLIMGWSWEFPVSSENLLELPGPAYDAIVQHAQAQMNRLVPSFAVDPNPKVPTENSSE